MYSNNIFFKIQNKVKLGYVYGKCEYKVRKSNKKKHPGGENEIINKI